MIDVKRLEAYFREECTVKEFAEQMHGVMMEFVLMAAHAGCDTSLGRVATFIEFLDGLRTAVLKACDDEDLEEQV